MTEWLNNTLDSFSHYYMQIGQLNQFVFFFLCGAFFIFLAWLWPNKSSQPLIHKGMIPDILYWFLSGRLIYGPLTPYIGNILLYLFLYTGIYSLSTLQHLQDGVPPVSKLPIALQAFLILLIMDCIQYWTHRLFHTWKFWKFHAIHHSPINVDWLTSARFHPVNVIIHSTCVYALVFMIGFSPDAWLVLAPFNMIYSPLVHANVNWTYGPFRYFLASPTFHRWHHTHIEEGGNKNFAPTFPFLDIIFGTYYDPKDKRPEVFGTPHDPISDSNILQQLAYPFIKKPKAEVTDGKI